MAAIDRMPRIERKAIQADVGIITVYLFKLLGAGMAGRAKALQFAEQKPVPVSMMRSDMISDRRRRDAPGGQAPNTERLAAQLRLG
jgi:hypothetical protein